MSVIKRPELIEDIAFNWPKEYKKALEEVIATSKKLGTNQPKVPGSDPKTRKNITELQKVQDQLNIADQKGTKLVIEHKAALDRRNKTTREAVKALNDNIALEKKQLGTLEKLALSNKKLTEERKKLNLETTKGQERLKSINSQLDKNNKTIKENNDQLGKQKISVGGYEEAIANATETGSLFSGGLKDIIGNFVGINEQEGGIKSFFKSFVGGIGAATKAALKFILTPIGAVIALIVAGIAALTAVISRNESASDKFNEVWEAATAILDVVAGRIIKLITAFGKFISGDFEGAANDVSDAFSNIGDAILEAGKRGVQIARLTVEVQKLNTVLKLTESALEGQIRKFEILADDATRSFKEREQAAEEARKLNILLARDRENVARKELQLTNEQIKQAIQSGTINRDLRDQQADAIAKLVTSESNALALELENEKTRRELKQDRLERDLDILIDGFDNIKTINDRIIEDEDRVLNKRIDTFNTLTDLSNKSFDKQIETIKKFTKIAFDENELLAEQDAVILNEKIRQLGLSEIIEGRLLEIVRERRIVLSEAADLERELTKAIIDQNAIRELDSKSLETTITDNQLKALDERIKNHKNANQEITDDDEEAQEQRQAIIEKGIELATQITGSFVDLRIQQISDELNAVEFARNRELEQAGDNERQKFEINKRFDEERKKLQREQANVNKANALFNIIISTAQAIASVSPVIPLMALAAAIGAAQAAVVIAAPIPQFDKGKERTPKDYIAGEKRPELRKSKGKWSLVNKPTLFTSSPGDKIVSGKETDSILGNMADLAGNNLLTDKGGILSLLNNELRIEKRQDSNLAYVLEKNNADLIRTIKNKKEVNIRVRNAKVTERSGNRIIHRIDYYYSR